MKTKIRLASLAVLALGLTAFARAESSSSDGAGGEKLPPDIVRRFDANVNGKLDPEEVAKWKAEEEKNEKAKAERQAAREKKEAEKKKKKKDGDK
jgi:hypothetical protein